MASARAGGTWHISCCSPSFSAGTQDLGVSHMQFAGAPHAGQQQQPLSFGRKFWMILGPETMAEAG